MFVKCFFEEIERHRAEKRVTLTRPAIAGHLKTAIMKADGFTYTTPLHERSRSQFAEIIVFQNYARRRMSNAYIGQTQYR